MAKVELKQPIVEEISSYIKDAQSVVLVDYRGLTVEQDTRLRKQLREAGITYKVYKNTWNRWSGTLWSRNPGTPMRACSPGGSPCAWPGRGSWWGC